MASWVFPTITTGVTVETATSGALSGDGSSGNKLAVGVDGVTIDVNGSNQLEGLGAAVAFKTIAVSGQSSIVADAADDTLTVVAGSNITLTTDAGTDTLTIAASGGGGGSPAGMDTQIQFNDSGSFGADAGLTFDKATQTFSAGTTGITGNTQLYVGSGGSGFFDYLGGAIQLGGDGSTYTQALLSGVSATGVTNFYVGDTATGDASFSFWTPNHPGLFAINDDGTATLDGTLQAAYKSSDGTAGISTTFQTGDGKTATVKDGVIVSVV